MVNFMLNGEVVGAESDADTPLLWVLREELKLRGTKFGCGIAQCGACTVHIDGNPMRSCVTPVSAVEGRSVTTIEGLATPVGEALKTAWTEAQVPQCGYCQSGQIMQAAGLLESNPNPSDDEIVNAMNGNLCRCMAYPRIKKAIKTQRMGGTVMKHQQQGLSRRSFIAGVAGSSLMMSMGSLVSGCSSEQASQALSSGDLSKVFSPNIWFEINGAGEVLINIIRAEMGQHVGTSLAQIVADELGADWSKVSFKHVDTDPKWGVMVTGGSWSVHTSFTQLSQAGAAGRTVIIDAASKLMGVSAEACSAENGVVSAGDKSLTFAEIVSNGDFSRSISEEELAAMPVKSAGERKVIGRDVATSMSRQSPKALLSTVSMRSCLVWLTPCRCSHPLGMAVRLTLLMSRRQKQFRVTSVRFRLTIQAKPFKVVW